MKSLGGCGPALVVAALALALGGCGGETAPGESRAASAEETSAALASTAESESSDAPATEQEVAWAGRVIDWAVRVGSAVEIVATSAEPLSKGEAPAPELRGPVTEALRSLGGCGRAADVGKAPSERLTPVSTAVDTACEHYADGAAAALGIVAGTGDREELAARWKTTWSEGGAVMSSISDALIRYQPANTRTLPERSGPAHESRVEPEFSEVASELVETDVEVRCWAARDWKALIAEMERFTRGRIREGTVGFAGHGDNRLNLAPEICDGLVALKYGSARPMGGKELAFLAVSVETLMHEAQHVRGVWTEPGAECYGLQMTRAAARKLGASKAYADTLARTYWKRIYELLPASYRSAECRDGGELDANPDSSVWP